MNWQINQPVFVLRESKAHGYESESGYVVKHIGRKWVTIQDGRSRGDYRYDKVTGSADSSGRWRPGDWAAPSHEEAVAALMRHRDEKRRELHRRAVADLFGFWGEGRKHVESAPIEDIEKAIAALRVVNPDFLKDGAA